MEHKLTIEKLNDIEMKKQRMTPIDFNKIQQDIQSLVQVSQKR